MSKRFSCNKNFLILLTLGVLCSLFIVLAHAGTSSSMALRTPTPAPLEPECFQTNSCTPVPTNEPLPTSTAGILPTEQEPYPAPEEDHKTKPTKTPTLAPYPDPIEETIGGKDSKQANNIFDIIVRLLESLIY